MKKQPPNRSAKDPLNTPENLNPKRQGLIIRWWSPLAALPGLGASFLPVGLCPACLPAYAGVLSSFGLGMILEKRYLLPLSVFFLALAMGALAYKAKERRGYGPLWLGILASGLILAGKFALNITWLVYLGAFSLLMASIWNALPVQREEAPCPACKPTRIQKS